VLLGDFNKLNKKPFMSVETIVVTKATRKSTVLYKIFMNIAAWYRVPALMPAVAKSDHNTVLFPLYQSLTVTVTVTESFVLRPVAW